VGRGVTTHLATAAGMVCPVCWAEVAVDVSGTSSWPALLGKCSAFAGGGHHSSEALVIFVEETKDPLDGGGVVVMAGHELVLHVGANLGAMLTTMA
jgi:hypothetical protein